MTFAFWIFEGWKYIWSDEWNVWLSQGFPPTPAIPWNWPKPPQKVIRWPHLPQCNRPPLPFCRLTFALLDLDNGRDNGIWKDISYLFLLKNWYLVMCSVRLSFFNICLTIAEKCWQLCWRSRCLCWKSNWLSMRTWKKRLIDQ